MKKRKLDNIVCPTCGKEYLPVEIFVPNAFFGRPLDILRDDDEKIISMVGDDSDTFESYVCDSCNTKFNIRAKVVFEVSTNDESDFDAIYSTPIKKDVLLLDEES